MACTRMVMYRLKIQYKKKIDHTIYINNYYHKIKIFFLIYTSGVIELFGMERD